MGTSTSTLGENKKMGRCNQVVNALKDLLDRCIRDSPSIKKVQLFSDLCVRQDKNSTILGILNMLATDHQVELEHVFSVRGQSYIPAHLAFGRVEKKLHREETILLCWQEMILLPSDYLNYFGTVRCTWPGLACIWHKRCGRQVSQTPTSVHDLTEAKRIIVRPAPVPVTVCSYYSALGEQRTWRAAHNLEVGGRSGLLFRPIEIISFQRMINARPRQPGEPLAVYKSELERLTTLALPWVHSCVKPAKKKDVAYLLHAIRVSIEVDHQAVHGPCTYPQTFN